jgi:hypothetical protein
MNMRRPFIRIFASGVLFAAVILTHGCGDHEPGSAKLFGAEIPSGRPVVELGSVLEDPAEFDGKSVVMRGVVSGQCPSLCWFYLLDGAHSVTVHSQGYSFPKLAKGSKVTIYALITSGEESVVVSALGLRVE